MPTFPQGALLLNRGEVEHARHPNERDRASYDARNWEPLFEAGVVELFDGEAEIVPGVRAVKAPGHNADMCIVDRRWRRAGAPAGRRSSGPTSCRPPRTCPTPWVMGYDLYPLTTMENKQRWLPRAAAGRLAVRLRARRRDAAGAAGRRQRAASRRAGRASVPKPSDQPLNHPAASLGSCREP